jgi:hypothetical protein
VTGHVMEGIGKEAAMGIKEQIENLPVQQV